MPLFQHEQLQKDRCFACNQSARNMVQQSLMGEMQLPGATWQPISDEFSTNMADIQMVEVILPKKSGVPFSGLKVNGRKSH